MIKNQIVNLKQIKHIKFSNQKNYNSQFDFIDLEELYFRENLDHSIEDHHKVNFYIILFIKEGNGFHTIDFINYPCSKGTLLTIRKDQIHKFNKAVNLKGSILIFTDDFFVKNLEKFEENRTVLFFNEFLSSPNIKLSDSDFNEISFLFNLIKNEYFEKNDNFQMSIIRSALHLLILKLYRIKSKNKKNYLNNKHLSEFIAFQSLVENNVLQIKKVNFYADEMNISTKTLNTITKSFVHKSAKEFIDEICIKQIKRLLINTTLSVKEIAYLTGFQETTNFYKYFKRHTQNTPEQFRNKM